MADDAGAAADRRREARLRRAAARDGAGTAKVAGARHVPHGLRLLSHRK